MKPKFYLLFLVLFFCHSSMSQVKSSSYNTILKTMLSHEVSEITIEEASVKENVLFLDSRSKEEYNVSHIEGAVYVGYEDFDLSGMLDFDKESEIIVYCSIGYRSEKITERLVENGFKNVKNLYGGIFEWKNQGNQVVNPEGHPTEDVHAYNRLWGIWLKKGNRVY